MMSRLGIFGGMFDPVHEGHLEAARYAKELLHLDCVKLIPCNIPNHRTPAYCSAAHRLAMLELVTKNEFGIEVDDTELRKASVSYSVETVKVMRANTVADSIVFILGMDSFNSIISWFDWEELFSICSFFVLGRSEARVNREVSQAIGLSERVTNDVAEFFQSNPGKIFVADEFDFDLSSTEVRMKLKRNLSVGESLDERVFQYIQKENLYQ